MLSILTKLGIAIIVGAAFVFGLVGAVYISLRGGGEVKVPNIIGKSRFDAEAELERIGLRMHKRAERYQEGEKPDIVLDQSPREGELIKNGQRVEVLISSAQPREGSYAQNGVNSEQPTEVAASGNTGDNANKNSKSKNENKNARRRQQDEEMDDEDFADGLMSPSANGNLNANAASRNANPNRNASANGNLNRNASNANSGAANRNASNNTSNANGAPVNPNGNHNGEATRARTINGNANAANRNVNPRVPVITPMSPNGKP